MEAESKSGGGVGLDDRIASLSRNLSVEKKQQLLQLLQEWQQTERRQDKRIGCLMPVDFSTQHRVYHEFIHDLSKGGVFIESRETFQIGEAVALTFTTPKYNIGFKLSGRIVRSGESGIGVEFDCRLTDYQKDIVRRNA